MVNGRRERVREREREGAIEEVERERVLARRLARVSKIGV